MSRRPAGRRAVQALSGSRAGSNGARPCALLGAAATRRRRARAPAAGRRDGAGRARRRSRRGRRRRRGAGLFEARGQIAVHDRGHGVAPALDAVQQSGVDEAQQRGRLGAGAGGLRPREAVGECGQPEQRGALGVRQGGPGTVQHVPQAVGLGRPVTGQGRRELPSGREIGQQVGAGQAAQAAGRGEERQGVPVEQAAHRGRRAVLGRAERRRRAGAGGGLDPRPARRVPRPAGRAGRRLDLPL